MKQAEFRVRPVSRYVVTKFEQSADGCDGGCSVVGEFPSMAAAEAVANAFLAKTRGGHPEVCNILPGHDIPGMLRNIAEHIDTGSISNVARGFLILEDGASNPCFGLGAKVGDPVELLDMARASLKRTGTIPE